MEGCILSNGFSPNGDGINDVFEIPCAEGNVYFSVWNRWGIEVYSNDKYVNDWDGTYKGLLQPQDFYVYIFKGKNIDGDLIDKKGVLLLLR